MDDTSVAIENSHHGDRSLLSIVLRRMKDAVPNTTFGGRSKPSSSFSPTRSLFALHEPSGEVKLYTMFGDTDPSGHALPGFVTGPTSQTTWLSLQTSNSVLLATLSEQRRSFSIYQFLKHVFKPGEDIHAYSQPLSQDSKFFVRFQTETAAQQDCNVIEYKIPFDALFEGLKPQYQVLQTVDSIQLLQNDTARPSLILSINDGKFVVVLQATPEGLIYRHFLKFPPTTTLADFCEQGSWCFALDTTTPPTPRVHVFNSQDGFYHGTIDVDVDHSLGPATGISVSGDLSTLVAYNTTSSKFRALDIDAYFLNHRPNASSNGVICVNLSQNENPPSSEDLVDKDVKSVFVDPIKARYERMKYLRWYEEGDMRLWSQNSEPDWVVASVDIEASGWNPSVRSYTAGDWITLSTGSTLKSIDWLFISPGKIFVTGSSSSPGVAHIICAVDRKNTSLVSVVPLKSPVLLVPESNTSSFYFFDADRLCAFLPDQSSDKVRAMNSLTSGLIIFDKPELAELLYSLNGWDRRLLKLQTLNLGLKYRQLDVIAPSLRSLDEEEQYKGAELLLSYTQENRHVVVQDETFWAQLLKLAMEFVSSIMRAKATSIGPKDTTAYGEISKYSDILTVLRNMSQRLRELALKGSAPSNSTDPSSNASSPTPTPNQSFKQLPFGSFRTSSSTSVNTSSYSGPREQSQKVPIASTNTGSVKDAASTRRSVSSSIKFSSSLDPSRDSPLLSSGLSSISSSVEASSHLGSLPGVGGGQFSSSSEANVNESSDRSNTNVADGERNAAHSKLHKRLDGLNRKVDSLLEMSAPFGRLTQRWEKLRPIDIIADALISGNISTALSFLQWRSLTLSDFSMGSSSASGDVIMSTLTPALTSSSKTLPKMTPNSPESGTDTQIHFSSPTAFHLVLNMACHLVYQCVALRKLEIAATILSHLGEDYDLHMKQIAWNTSYKAIRDMMLPNLLSSRPSLFSASELETMRFLEQLEQAYPSHGFSTPLSSNESVPAALQEDLKSTLKFSNVPDYHIDPNYISNLVASQHDLSTGLEELGSSATEGVHPLTFSCRLHYLHRMITSDPSTKIRLLFDAKIISNPTGALTQIEADSTTIDSLHLSSLLAYFTSHNDWKRLIAWFTRHLDASIDDLPSGSSFGSLDERGAFRRISDNNSTIDTLVEATGAQSEKRALLPSTEQQLKVELAKRRIFVPSDRSSFSQLLRLLSHSNALFRENSAETRQRTNSSHRYAVDIEELLPVAKLSPLHLYMIEQCVEQKLVSLLSSYLDHYQLSRTPDAIRELEAHLNKSMPGQTWPILLLQMSNENTLFEASLSNAQMITRSKVPVTVNAMISSNTIKKRPLMALGTLLYAPASLDECISPSVQDTASSWHLEASQLSDLCSAFPLVHQSIFPTTHRDGHSSARTDPLAAVSRVPRSSSSSNDRSLLAHTQSFDLLSAQGDINLHHLLTGSASFTLTPFAPLSETEGYDSAEAASLSFDLQDSRFEELRFVDHADAAFFLCQGQPFKAYRCLLNHFARERSATSSPAGRWPQTAGATPGSSGMLSGPGRPKPTLSIAPNSIPLNEAPKIMRMVRQVAFQNVYDDSVVASCVALLELCEYKSLDLKVDCRALVRLVDFCVQSPVSIFAEFGLPSPAIPHTAKQTSATSSAFVGSEHLARKDALKHLTQLINSTYSDTPGLSSSSQSLSKSLENGSINPRETLSQLSKMLERATEMAWDQVGISPSGRSSSVPNMSTISAQVNNWSLLVFFNTVHRIPLGEAPLSNVAMQNDWVAFLYYAQVLGYPAEQTVKLCSYFSDANLRDHLTLCLNQMLPHEAVLPKLSSSASALASTSAEHVTSVESNSTINQLFQSALAAQSNIYPGESLLQFAISSKRPLVSVLALCFPDVTIVNCITVWLSISVPLTAFTDDEKLASTVSDSPCCHILRSLVDFASNMQISTSSNASNRVTRLLKSTSSSAFSTSSIQSTHGKTHSLDTLYAFSRFFVLLCANGQVQYMIRALEIFEPSHILLIFLRGLQAFTQARFVVASSLMREIFQILQAAPITPLSEIRVSPSPLASPLASGPVSATPGSSSSGTNTTLLLGDVNWVSALVLETCDLLIKFHMPTTFERREFLHVLACAHPSKFESLFRDFVLLEKMDLVNTFTSVKTGFSFPPSSKILSELVRRAKFDDARNYAASCGRNVHEVTVLEAEDLLARLKLLLLHSRNSSTRNISGSTVGSREGTGTLGDSQQDQAKERASIWRQISGLLVQRKCRPDISGRFFLDHAHNLDYIITGGAKTEFVSSSKLAPILEEDTRAASDTNSESHQRTRGTEFGRTEGESSIEEEEDDDDVEDEEEMMTIETAATEQIQLLSLAIQWLEGSKNAELQLFPSDYASAPTNDRFGEPSNEDGLIVPQGGFNGNVNLWVPQEQLDMILAKILRLSVLAQSESTKKTPSVSSSVASSNMSTSSSPSVSSASRRRKQKGTASKFAKMDLSNVDPEVLESLVGKLLNQSDSLSEAEKTAKELGVQSRELKVAKVMVELASGNVSGLSAQDLLLREDLLQLVELSNPNMSINYTTTSTTDVLTYVARIAKHSIEYTDRVIARFKVAYHLGIDYEELLSKNSFEVLQYLIQEGANMLPLAKQFSSALFLDKDRIALMLAEMCYRVICDVEGNVSRLSTSTVTTGSSSALNISASAGFNRASLGPSPNITPSSSVTDLSTLSAKVSRTTAAASSSSASFPPSASPSPQPLATFFSNKYWQEYVDMATPRASLVGDEILRLLSTSISKPNFATSVSASASSSQLGSVSSSVSSSSIAVTGGSGPTGAPNSSVAYNVEIELIIRAFACYRVGLDVLKQARLFDLIEERVPIYVEARQFKSLVRLITGIKLYGQLQYILDILVQYDCFDMLLSRNVYHLEDGDDRKELQLALFNFLKGHYPSHIDKMKLLFLRFNMFREHADLLHERGWTFLNTMKSRLEPQTLLQALDCFLEAASMYAKDKAYGLEAKCLDVANLIQLQFELPDTRIVNLKESQAQLFLTHCPIFSHSLIVAKSYILLKQSNWIEPIFHQVIVCSNWNYWSELEAQLPLERGLLFSKLVKRVKQELASPNAANTKGNYAQLIVSNTRLFLENLEDHYLRLKYARDLGLNDVIEQLSGVLGVEYTTLIIS